MRRITIAPILQSSKRKDGLHNIIIRITQNKKRKYITTDININFKDFNTKAKFGYWVRNTNLRASHYNGMLIEFIHKIEDIVSNTNIKTLDNIVKLIKGNFDENILFGEYTIKYLERNNHLYKPASKKRYYVAISDIKQYTEKQDIQINLIDKLFLEGLYNFCRARGNSFSTINSKFAKIKHIINEAIKDKIIKYDENPFLNFIKQKDEKPKRDKLSEDEIEAIKQLELKENTPIWHARNVFMFQFYCAGMRISDVLTLKWVSVKDNKMSYKMNKTGDIHTFKLMQQAIDILQYYKPKNINDQHHVFPYITNLSLNLEIMQKEIGKKTALINKYLKEIGKKIDTTKKITTHIARHSFATIANKKVKDIEAVSKLLGHSDISTTKGYLASLDDERLDEAMNKIFDL